MELRIRISARRRLGPFSIEPDIDGLRVEKNLTLHQPRLLDIFIPGAQKLESAALRQKHHEVFRPLDHYPHNVPENVMGNLKGIALTCGLSGTAGLPTSKSA